MDLRRLIFTVTLLFAERIWSLPLACTYNGTAYGEGETVRTEEPCLFCACRSGALECSLRVCADQPSALPPGCFFLHKPDECCPQLFCEEESFNPTGVELRTGFKLESKLNGNGCAINGSLYAEGSAVASSQVCEYCYCVEGEMKCIKPRCLQSFEGCKAIYEKSSCCPTHYDCRDADADILRTQIENFVVASVESKTSSKDSSTALSNLNLETGKADFKESEPDEKEEKVERKEEEEEGEEEAGATTTEEPRTEETTLQPEKEATTPTEDDSLAPTGFQMLKTEYFNKEPTAVGSAGETTPAPEATTDVSTLPREEAEEAPDFRIQNKVDFPEATETPVASTPSQESRNDSAQEVDDYDSYDYGEPQLPPSLPNLVIFPFVAADAVVKDDAGTFEAHDNVDVKRIDAHPVFYKDYFSPPAKTEGGFVPKEPFYEQTFFREDQMESPGADAKGALLCQDIACQIPEFDKQWTRITSASGAGGDLNPVQLGQEVRPQAEAASDFVFKDESPTFQKSQTKKPVTVTYKNVVVDFYPNYLITTTRARPKIQPSGHSPTETQSAADLAFRNAAARPNIQNSIAGSSASAETKPGSSEGSIASTSPKSTRGTPTTAESSFFDQFLKSFLSDDIISTPAVTTTTTTTTTSTKHKYSSKIKGHANAVRDEGSHKMKPEVSDRTSSTESLLNILIRKEDPTTAFPETDKPKVYGPTRKQVKKEGIEGFAEPSGTAAPEETGSGTEEYFHSLRKENLLSEKGQQEEASRRPAEESNAAKPEAGALLKLAGCNIYGMMYRVGKLITELSGPCLECLCTDFGVQCKPLGC